MSELVGTKPLWADPGALLQRPALSSDLETDVCVVGGGIAGLLCAYRMAGESRRVVVVTDGGIGSGETGRTTSHLSNAIDDRYFVIERLHGTEAARTLAESHSAAIDLLEEIASIEKIACGFRRVDGYLFLPPGESEKVLELEQEAARRAGLEGVQRVESAPSFNSGPCLRFPRQGQLHAMAFLNGLAAACEKLGVRIFTGTRAVRIEGGEPAKVTDANGRTVRAGAVIVATNAPVSDLFAVHTKQEAFRTYALAAEIPAGSIPSALYWDTSEVAGDLAGAYHYVRVSPGADHGGAVREGMDVLIVGGGDHPTGEVTDAWRRWDALEAWARERWPMMGEVTHRWSGQVQEPLDHVAFIGKDPGSGKNVYVVTGDSGMGWTHAGVAAILLPALVRGEEHPWEKLYDPARKPTAVPGEFLRHLGSMSGGYVDWARPGSDLHSLEPGEGRVVRRGLSLLAVHRDDGGALHARSAACTHLGCVVRWNGAEKSWDCPCHGSRFDAMGKVISGPAVHDLHVVKGVSEGEGR